MNVESKQAVVGTAKDDTVPITEMLAALRQLKYRAVVVEPDK